MNIRIKERIAYLLDKYENINTLSEMFQPRKQTFIDDYY